MPASGKVTRIADTRPAVVVVDDDAPMARALARLLQAHCRVEVFTDPKAAVTYFENSDVDLALVDVNMPELDGITLLQRFRALQPSSHAVLMSATASIPTVLQGLRIGASDFVVKPADATDEFMDKIRHFLSPVSASAALARADRSPKDAFEKDPAQALLIGSEPSMIGLRQRIAAVARFPGAVLITGESGTGKELVARALHAKSPRADKPFIAVNCGAFTESLIDSELFGHEKGAFTGATEHIGLFEAADGGTLFLDEIGDVPLSTQVRLLRALENGEIRRVGSTKTSHVDVRVIAATNVDLPEAVREKRFRMDLMYRLSTFRLPLPPLRERRQDIPLLANHLLLGISRRLNLPAKSLSKEAVDALMAHDWPGNVRELVNVIEGVFAFAQGESIGAAELEGVLMSESGSTGLVRFLDAPPLQPLGLPSGGAPSSSLRDEVVLAESDASAGDEAPHDDYGLDDEGDVAVYSVARRDLLSKFEKKYCEQLLAECGGDLAEASRRSHIDRSNLRRMLARYDLLPKK